MRDASATEYRYLDLISVLAWPISGLSLDLVAPIRPVRAASDMSSLKSTEAPPENNNHFTEAEDD